MTEINARIVAVIVTYHPHYDGLARLLGKLKGQADALVIVDNGSAGLAQWIEGQPYGAVLIGLGDNLGIAQAQNAGIARARQLGATHILLFDHDSDPPADLAPRLLACLQEREKREAKIAAVGPRYVDKRWSAEARSPFSRFINGRMVGCNPPPGSPYVAVDFLIASGSLIPVAALDAIGEMNEPLFIDYVDIEWGVRARSAGWALYGVWDIVMEHGLGDDRAIIFGRAIPVHSPLRHYYAIRNAAWLALHSRLEAKWRFGIACNGVRRLIAYGLFMPQPLKHIGMMSLGLWHGVRGRMGRL